MRNWVSAGGSVDADAAEAAVGELLAGSSAVAAAVFRADVVGWARRVGPSDGCGSGASVGVEAGAAVVEAGAGGVAAPSGDGGREPERRVGGWGGVGVGEAVLAVVRGISKAGAGGSNDPFCARDVPVGAEGAAAFVRAISVSGATGEAAGASPARLGVCRATIRLSGPAFGVRIHKAHPATPQARSVASPSAIRGRRGGRSDGAPTAGPGGGVSARPFWVSSSSLRRAFRMVLTGAAPPVRR